MKEAAIHEDKETPKVPAIESEEGKISFEQQEFYNWCDANDIDRAVEGMDDDDRKSFLKIERHFTTAIKEKRLVVDGDKLVYTISDRSPTKGEKLTVRRPNGRAMLAMDGYKESQQNQKLQAFIAAISGVEKRDSQKISTLDDKDYKVLQDVALLFLTA
jgi:hypothetical protein